MKPKRSTCRTCGYSWVTGTLGGHSCAEHLKALFNKPRPERQKKERLSLDFPAGGKAQLESVRARAGAATMSEAVRRAIALLDLVLEAQAANGKLVIEYPDGRKETVRIL